MGPERDEYDPPKDLFNPQEPMVRPEPDTRPEQAYQMDRFEKRWHQLRRSLGPQEKDYFDRLYRESREYREAADAYVGEEAEDDGEEVLVTLLAMVLAQENRIKQLEGKVDAGP